jgi:putative tryptophan/tyrosine transport system substrate-binding protein
VSSSQLTGGFCRSIVGGWHEPYLYLTHSRSWSLLAVSYWPDVAGPAWPQDVRADEQVRRIGILWRGNVTEGVVQAQQAALREELAKLGWIEDRNVRFDVRYSVDDPERIRANADELIALDPDVIAASSFPVARVVSRRTQRIPIVFINVGDPVVGGLVKNIARPEGNFTGITSTYESLGEKWLELLKEAAPKIAPGCAHLRP